MDTQESGSRILYWEFLAVFFGFFALMIGFAFTGGRAMVKRSEPAGGEDAFALQIEQLHPLEPSVVRYYEDFGDFMTRGRPNLIVRVTFQSRGDCAVHDPFGDYSDGDLWVKTERTEKMIREGDYYVWDDPDMELHNAAASYISTPYEVKVQEVLHGSLLSQGDVFTFWAQYGIVEALDRWTVRYADYPVFRLGNEYILFLSVSDIIGGERIYELVNPASAVEITKEHSRSFRTFSSAADRQFEEAENDCELLTELIRRYYAAAPYPLTPEKYNSHAAAAAETEGSV